MAAELVEDITAGNCLPERERDFDEVGDDFDDNDDGDLDDFNKPTIIVGSTVAINM